MNAPATGRLYGVGTGPGNFTGIRIAVSAARGLALALEIPAIGVSNFDAIHHLHPDALAAVPAPRDHLYVRRAGGAPDYRHRDTLTAAPVLPPSPTALVTAMAQIAAEVLNIALDSIKIVHPDTDVTPYDMSTLGSRSTFHMGHAVRLAAQDARDKLDALAEELGLPGGANLPVPELFVKKIGMQAGNIIGTASYIPSYAPPNPETGQSQSTGSRHGFVCRFG